MGLWSFLKRLFFPSKPVKSGAHPASQHSSALAPAASELVPLRHPVTRSTWSTNQLVLADAPPYRFARPNINGRGEFLDLSRDVNNERLTRFGLPNFATPEQLASWLGISIGQLAWLVHRFTVDARPKSQQSAHYHCRWVRKRSGGLRLIESPKPILKAVQSKILREILDRVPPHPSAHGFAAGRSIVTNAKPHVGRAVLLKMDLENFYPTVTMARVTAIFRSIGYSREAAIWLARLTTSALPMNTPFIKSEPAAILPYLRRHLPQGAPTSPALANLSAWGLDVRLSGLARSFGATYTRYADDLTFSGPEEFIPSLRDFIPLVTRVIRAERFRVHKKKRKVIRDNARQTVTGVVVNQRLNVQRSEFDRLKAILTNCARHGPSSQNRENHENFTAHLRGRIAQISQLNPKRGSKLLGIYQRIDWRR
ncbi:MAG: reverse transcriptase family protein [Planctomycetaceae bacterium]